MAQRMMHYLLGELLLEQPGLGADAEAIRRFRMGNLLPDAYLPETPDRALRRRTHFIADIGETGRFSDFDRFTAMFPGRFPADALYLGYYLHLVEDACFRVFWHSRELDAEIRSMEDVSYLHCDYRLLNRRLARQYALQNRAEPIAGLESEPINAIYPFSQEKLLARLAEDFGSCAQGEPKYLTAAIADEFIGYALPICRDALERVLGGREPLPPLGLRW